jgi:phosphonoacetaldehyde hydrolase
MLTKPYSGPLRAVILDWVGTVVDFGSRAPADAYIVAFRSAGVAISVDEARLHVGLPKWDHIRAIGQLPEVRQRWTDVHGRPFDDADAAALYEKFLSVSIDTVGGHAGLLPGTLETVEELRRRGLRIGSTTGYTRAIMDALMPEAARRGYRPDCVVCAGEVPDARPAPLACLQAMILLNVWPAAACVKVDDTVTGIEEGLNAGMWTVAVALTGNEMGLSEAELSALPPAEFKERKAAVHERFQQAGAHYVIDGIRDLIPVLEDIERRMVLGAAP